MDIQAVYVPVGVPTFHLESAQDQFERSVRLLRAAEADVVCPEEMLLVEGRYCLMMSMVTGSQPHAWSMISSALTPNVLYSRSSMAGLREARATSPSVNRRIPSSLEAMP